MISQLKITTAALSVGVAFAPLAAFAQASRSPTALDEVTVTASRFKSNLQTTAVAVSAFPANTLLQRQIVNVGEIGSQIPGLVLTPAAGLSSVPRIAMRGVQSESGDVKGDPVVGIYVDNVYQPRPQTAFMDFFDIEGIEVLRGPQGTLYGRNTSAGALKITTKRPSQVFTYGGDVAVGSYNAVDIRGAVSGPLAANKVAGSLSFVSRRRDGTMNAPAYGQDVNNRDSRAVRAKLLFTPTDKLDIELAASAVRDQSDLMIGTSVSVLPGVVNPKARFGRDLRTSEFSGPRAAKTIATNGSINASYRATETLTFSSITGYGKVDNTSATPFTQRPNGVDTGLSYSFSDQFWSEELNATYNTERLDLVGGLFYFHEDGTLEDGGPYRASATYDRLTTAKAVFAQGTYHLPAGVGLTAGFRYTSEDADFTQFYRTLASTAQRATATFTATTPKIGIDWQANRDLFLYASYTEGFKSGGFGNIPPTSPVAGGSGRPLPYEAETVKNIEVGVKYQTPDRRFRINAAVYQAKYDALQLPVRDPVTLTAYTSNASGAEVTGLELEPLWQVTDALRFYGSISIAEGKYTAPFQCSGADTRFTNCSDRDLKGLSPLKSDLGMTYTTTLWSGEVRLNADWEYSDAFPNNVSNQLQQVGTPKYDLLNASVSWTTPDGHWTVSLEGRNITDEEFAITTIQIANLTSPALTAYPNEPRTVMARVKASF